MILKTVLQKKIIHMTRLFKEEIAHMSQKSPSFLCGEWNVNGTGGQSGDLLKAISVAQRDSRRMTQMSVGFG